MENINKDKFQSNQNDSLSTNNYNNNIIDNSSKKFIFDFDSLFKKLREKKNKDEIILNEYQTNLLMIFFKKIGALTKILLLKLLYLFNNNPKNDDYKYYIFKKLTKIFERIRDQEIMEINFDKNIDIFIEQGKFFYEKGNKFYAYHFLSNGLYKDNPNIRNLRHKIKDEMFEENRSLREYFLKLNQKEYKDIYAKLKEISKNEINKDSNQMLYVVNNNWLINAIKFIKNILNFKSYEFEAKLSNNFSLNEIYMNYFQSLNNYEDLYPYPGQVENYSISDFRDIWNDPLNEDENFLLKKNLSFNKDYSLVNENNWNFINELFGSTNIIKRKINNLQLIKFKVIILDKRFIKEHINFFKPKYIQTKLKINIKDFKEKISRCINHSLKNYKEVIYNDDDIMNNAETDRFYNNSNLMNNNNSESRNRINQEDVFPIKNFNFYKIKKVNKPLLIEFFTSYINGINTYESLYIEKINLEDENNLEDIFKFFDKKNDLLIIELIENDCQAFLQPKKYDNNGLYQCSVCRTKISFMERYNCDRCNFSIFCSKKCSEIESPVNLLHNKLHEYIKQYQTKALDNSSINKYNNLVGLMNLGNTCFINSSLQCLFHTKELSNYFLNNFYIKEINKENSQGTKGLIAEGFADLFKEMQTTNSDKVNPINFLRTFFKINKSLYAGMQHDAQEFLSILLDNLHEDLNRINKKPYVLLEEQKEYETDQEASERFWNYYKMRENSIIVDLFHGQFKCKISCMDCGNVSINYDPYIFLGLPIPEKENRMVIKFVFNNKLEYFGFNLNANSNILELKKKAVEHMKMCGYNVNEKNEVLYNNIEFVFFDDNKIIKKIFNDKNKLFDNELLSDTLKANKPLELVLYEKKLDKNYFNIYVYPIKEYDYSTSSYPISLSVTEDMTFREIIDENREKILNMYINVNQKEKIIFGILHKKNTSWAYYISNIFDSKEYCPVCNNREDNYCKINDNIILGYFLNKIKNYAPVLFVMGTSNKAILNRNMKIKENLDNGVYFLNDCLKFFCEEELLNKENMWYCNKCKRHNKAKKQIKLYKMPKYLIIQLKKFENKAGFFNYVNEKKKDVYINYPINNLNLSDFIEDEEQKKYRYDLYAVIQHHGTINEGHYTAIININDNWVLYNDSKLYGLNNPVTNDAYILFYKMNE